MGSKCSVAVAPLKGQPKSPSADRLTSSSNGSSNKVATDSLPHNLAEIDVPPTVTQQQSTPALPPTPKLRSSRTESLSVVVTEGRMKGESLTPRSLQVESEKGTHGLNKSDTASPIESTSRSTSQSVDANPLRRTASNAVRSKSLDAGSTKSNNSFVHSRKEVAWGSKQSSSNNQIALPVPPKAAIVLGVSSNAKGAMVGVNGVNAKARKHQLEEMNRRLAVEVEELKYNNLIQTLEKVDSTAEL